MSEFDKFCNMENWVVAPNLSHGFHGVLLEYIHKYYKKNSSMLMLAENKDVNYIFEREFSGIKIKNNCYSGAKGEEFIDLNRKQDWTPKYDFVFSQALLEHVSRPCVVLENMVDSCLRGGMIIIHTQNIQMGYHAVPIDCLRFFQDWFVDMQKYLPIKMVEWNEFGPHLFCVYKKENT